MMIFFYAYKAMFTFESPTGQPRLRMVEWISLIHYWNVSEDSSFEDCCPGEKTILSRKLKKRKIKRGGIWMLLQTSWNLPTLHTRVSCSLGFCWRYHGILAKKCLYSRKRSQAKSVKVASQNREECPGWLQTGQNLMACTIPLWMKCKGLVPMELKICANACLAAKLLSRPLNHEGTCKLTF